MQERYNIDLSEPGMLQRRSKRWLEVRILGLLGVESRLQQAMFPPKEQ